MFYNNVLGFIVRGVDRQRDIYITVSTKNYFFLIVNYVAHSRGLSYLSNMHTNASRAESETFCAFTVGSDTFHAPNSFSEVLWILA